MKHETIKRRLATTQPQSAWFDGDLVIVVFKRGAASFKMEATLPLCLDDSITSQLSNFTTGTWGESARCLEALRAEWPRLESETNAVIKAQLLNVVKSATSTVTLEELVEAFNVAVVMGS